MNDRRRDSLRWAALGVGPAWLVGRAVVAASGGPPAMLVLDTAALALGIGLVTGAGPWLRRRVAMHAGAVAVVATVVIAASLLVDPGAAVQRWIALGPVRLHPSAILAPMILSCLARLSARCRHVHALLAMAVVQAIHVLQPDAGQATAFGAGCLVVSARGDGAPRVRALGAILVAVGVALAWSRPDPLAPVRFVEAIVGPAFALHGIVGVLAIAALLVLPGAAIAAGRVVPAAVPQAHALAAYFATAIVVAFIGDFPVPVLGHGASPILGAVLGLALLAPPVAPSGSGEEGGEESDE